MATVSSPLSSTLSNKREDSLDTTSNRSPHTPFKRKLKRFQSAFTDDQHGESKCKHCGWRYPIRNPDSRQRRQHKKICPKLPSLDSEGENGGSGDYGDPDYSESGGSSVLTVDHDLRDTASRKKLPFSETEHEKETERDTTSRNLAARAADAKLTQGSNAGNHGCGAWEEKVEASKEKELGSGNPPKKDPQEAHPTKIASSDVEPGSDSGLSSAAEAGEHETDPSDDMKFESSDVVDGAKREDSLQSDDDMLKEEKKYGGASQNQHSRVTGRAESSHAGGGGGGESRTDSEGEGNPVNVANLITKFENAHTTTSTVDDNVALPRKNRRSKPLAKSGETGLLSLSRSKGRKNVGEITSAAGEIVEEERQSSGGGEILGGGEERQSSLREALKYYDLELLLKKQRTHDLVCPVCGSRITNRIIVRKKRRTFSRKKEAPLPTSEPNLQEISLEPSAEPSSDEENDVKGIAGTARSRGTWVESFSYLGLFRRGSREHGD